MYYPKQPVKFIGQVRTKTHINYKVLLSARIWGKNYHTTGVIFLYDTSNKYVGKYVLGDMFDLPSKIENNKLIFMNEVKNSDCDSNIITEISFDDGIPSKIFLKCKGEYYRGVYSFTSSE